MSGKQVLDTGIRFAKNVGRFTVGRGSLAQLKNVLVSFREASQQQKGTKNVVFLVDEFFEDKTNILKQPTDYIDDRFYLISTKEEPTTDGIDELTHRLIDDGFETPAAIVGMGGGITMDTAKAVANLLTNGGKAYDYQGWDLVKVAAVPKIGVPTISGTGAEATRTCVMTNTRSGLKLGMNSDFTVFDHVIMDPDVTVTVPRHQYFFTGMDAYLHCMESLSGSYRNAIGDAYSREAVELCRQVFSARNMMDPDNRERLMVASYFGGCAIATSYVGIVHPFSAALSVVLGLHHCVANCIVMRAMSEFYPTWYDEFWLMTERQEITVPSGVCCNLSERQYRALYEATIIHEKPLTNAIGQDFRSVLTFDKVVKSFLLM